MKHCFQTVESIVARALEDVPEHVLMPDTNIFIPHEIGKINGSIKFKKVSSDYGISVHRNFVKDLFSSYDVSLAPGVIAEVFPKRRKKKSATNYRRDVKGKQTMISQKKVFRGPINAFKQRRVQLANEGMFCDENMVDTTSDSYRFVQDMFDECREAGLHGADLELGPLVTYFNLMQEPTTLLSFDSSLVRSVNKTWSRVRDYHTFADVRQEKNYFPAPNLFSYLD